jgi:hypothetical protein
MVNYSQIKVQIEGLVAQHRFLDTHPISFAACLGKLSSKDYNNKNKQINKILE